MWWVIILLLGVCIAGPYAGGVRPRNRRDWRLVVLTVTFLVWLGLIVPLR